MAKMLILTFEHGEDELIEKILYFTNEKSIKVHKISDKVRKLSFHGLGIDLLESVKLIIKNITEPA